MIVAGLALIAAMSPAAEYAIAPAPDSRVELFVHKTGLMSGKTHHFVFSRYQGTLDYDREHPETARVSMTIDPESLSNTDTWLSDRDRAKVQAYALNDMLAATRYPEILFVSSAVRRIAPDRYEITGQLTIRGMSQAVTFTVTENPALTFQGESRFRMTEFKLKPPTAALGMVGTKDEMDFAFTLHARPR